MTLPRPGSERVCLLVIRCSVEDRTPETLRIRTTYYPNLTTGVGEVRVFATVESVTAAVAEALGTFVARTSTSRPDRPPGRA